MALTLTITLLTPKGARAEMPAKAKAFLTIVGYGTVSGALLGAASMAFGKSTRMMAQGASIGLYAGLIFGTYVLVSHNNRQSGNYDDSDSPYKESRDIYGDEYDPSEGGANGAEERATDQFFERMQARHMKFRPNDSSKGRIPPLYMNLLRYDF